MRKILFVLTLILITLDASARGHRSGAARAQFVRIEPCPSTGFNRGKCPGYVIDHIDPLCNGGADSPSNMQWQTILEGKRKDRLERRLCRNKRRGL